jgi:hypothetical protein
MSLNTMEKPKLNIHDIFITFALCYKPRLQVNGKEKDPIYFSRNYPLPSRE